MVCQPRDRLLDSGMIGGSTGIVASELARALGGDIELTFHVGSDSSAVELKPGPGRRPVVLVPAPGNRLEHGRELLSALWPRLPAHSASTAFHRQYYEQVAELIGREPPDLIHLHTFLQHAPMLRSAGGAARLVLHLHHPHPIGLDPQAAARAFEAVDAVVTCSAHVAQRIAAHFPAHAAKVVAIGNGVDPGFFTGEIGGGPTPRPRLLYVGRLSPEKGVHVLAEAFNRVVAQFPEATLDLVGRAGYLSASILRQFGEVPRAAGLDALYGRNPITGFARQVVFSRTSYPRSITRILSPSARLATRFLGAVPYDQMPQTYAQSMIVVVPSVIQEPFGLPVVEAMAAGRAVVASRVGGIPELVADGRTGLLVEPPDPGALADALLALLGDPERCRAMGAAGRRDVAAHWTWQLAAERLRAVYGSLGPGSLRS
jgi:glycosyltransferase involved in cell wall biosynthesis